MRKVWIRAERDSEVRQAARAWHKAGAIDDQAAAAVNELFPTPWPEPSLVWKILSFFFVTFGVAGLFAAFATASREIGAVAFFMAVILAASAEWLRPSPSGPASASGAAAAFWSVVCLMIGTAAAENWGTRSVTPLLIVAAAAWLGAAWRWGYPVFAVFSAVSFFLLLAQWSGGRVFWLVAAPVLVLASVPLLDRPALAPSHRNCAAGVLAVSTIAFYAAINPYSSDRGIVEAMAASREPAMGFSAFPPLLTVSGAVLLPLVLLAWGIRSRRRLLLNLALAFAALSLATLRYYIHIAPLWAVLAGAGALSIGLALALLRWLNRAPGRERRGFTADVLFEDEDRQQALGVAAAALTLAPEARGAPAAAQPGDFRGGGGASGGGGSSGSF